MANLNLSEFTEKTFVADADWTFVWDTTGLISKKVSRNNWLNSGTLTTSAPVTISQTWNALAVAFTAFKVNAVSTASAAGSLLLDLQVGGVSQFYVNKGGVATSVSLGNYPSYEVKFGSLLSGIGAGSASNTLLVWSGNTSPGFANANLCLKADTLHLKHAGRIVFGQGDFGWGAEDTILLRDAANTLALRNGTNAQTFNVYGTYSTSPSLAYSRLAIACDTSGNATLTTQSTGTAGTVSINGVPVGLGKGNTTTNIAIGSSALNSFGSGGLNVAIGLNALSSHINVSTTTAVGVSALQNITSGDGNTVYGRNAGRYITANASLTSATNSVFLGFDARAAANSQDNQIVIGYDATGLGSNTAVLGNASITTTALRGNVGIGTTAPSSKLQVSAGDVEVDTIAKGVILKSPDGTRYRVTVANGGTLSVAAV